MAFTTGGASTISMLMLVDLFRGTERSNWGQWWYESYGQPSQDGLDKPGMGWDFLLYDDRIQAVDYRNVLPLHWFWSGYGVVFSRDNWTDAGTCVVFKASRVVETHDDHDQGSIQIYKGGENPSSTSLDIVDSFLLGDCLAFGRGGAGGPNRWQTGYHCAYKLGSQSQSSPGAQGYWNSKFMQEFVPDTSSGDITRQIGPPEYSYALGDCSTAYVANNNNETSPAYGMPRITDHFSRQMFHIRAVNLLFVYDRVKFTAAYAAGPASAFWHWPRTYPTLYSPNVYVLDAEIVAPASSERNRIFCQIVLPVSPPSWNFFDGALPTAAETFDTGGAYVNIPLQNGAGQVMYAFQPKTTATTAMQVIVPISSGNMNGGTIFTPTTRYHVVFSADPMGLTPPSPYYDVSKYDQNDKHYVCDLTPDVQYLVSEASLGGSEFRYTLTTGQSQGFFSNSAGVLEFSPSQVAGQSIAVQTYSDVMNATDAYTTVQKYSMLVLDTMSAQDSTVMEPSGLLQMDFNDTMSVSDSIKTTEYPIYYDAVGSRDELVMDKVVTVVLPERVYIEKFINTGSLDLKPRADLGASIFTPDPNNGSLWDKVADEDDTTWIEASGPNAGSAQIECLVSDPELYLGRIEQFQYVVRVRFADTQGSSAPYLRCAIGQLGLQVLAATTSESKPLFSTLSGAVDYVFEPIRVPISRSVISRMSLVAKVGATSVGGKFLLQISRIGIRILQHSSTEKVV